MTYRISTLACTTFAASCVLAATASAVLAAAAYPDRPIRLVVPFAPGGNVDTTARALVPGLNKHLPGTIVVDNRPSAGGYVAAGVVADATPDGYTLLIGASGTLSIAVAASDKPRYDPTRDFIPITMVSMVPLILVVPMSSPATSVDELVKFAKSKRGKLNMATAGHLGTPHLTGALFQHHTGTQFVFVPYKGGGQAMGDLISGNIDAMFSTLPSAISHVQGKRLRGLMITASKARAPGLPEVPTVKEAGLPEVEALNFSAILAPAKTPRSIIKRLNEVTVSVLQMPETERTFERFGAVTNPSSPEEASRFIQSDIEKWRKLIRAAGIQTQL